MKNSHPKTIIQKVRRLGLLALALGTFLPGAAAAFNLSVVDHDGNAISNGFSWLLEEDNTTLTQLPVAGQPVTQTKSISLDIHKSYAPVVGSGRSATDTAVITPPDPAGRYVLSVLPDAGYTLGGINVTGDPAEVKVVVHAQPIPTAQISVLVFKDHNPINNVYDAGEEYLENAVVTIHDAGGQMMQDAFGNPLGTDYDTDPLSPTYGDVVAMGNGIIKTDADGVALVKFLAPGKYGVVVSPPAPLVGGQYIQTSTIEGTRVVDAWVKADEPPVFVEGFGTGFHHVFFGFVNPNELPWYNADLLLAGGGGTNAITGDLRYNHFGRPPSNQGFFIGPPVKDCWVGLNDPVTGQGLYAAPCYDGLSTGATAPQVEIPSSFYIPNVPPGTYELVTWDKPLDALFGFHTVTMPDTATDLNLGTILSFRWFGSFLGKVFLDDNENGFFDNDGSEFGLPEQNINIRFRDGTIYQAQPTDIEGGYALEEVFPFFKWLVVEVDFARFKATGITAAIDHGGEIPAGFDENDPWALPTFDQLTPQPQAEVNPNTGNNLSRTETGPVLTQAMHLFLNQTNVIDWGKNTYTDSENGGISGIVFYAVTRAENDPRYAAAEPWEPGITRVQINLYRDANDDGVIDDVDGDGLHTAADVDNYPLGNFPGPEDLDRNSNTIFDSGDALNITYTDSFDDSAPSDCIQDLPIVHGQPIPECADAFGTWNQVRPGTFDGGYAFSSYFPGGMNSGSTEVDSLPNSTIYIVEAATPPGYILLKEEDKNVDFGNEHQPSTQLLPPVCVGDLHAVPQYLSFQTDDAGLLLAGITDPIEVAQWGQDLPLCNRKKIGLNAKENGAADFFFFTKVPKAARAVGFANNDLSAEFNQGSPNFGEKAAPSWIPVSFKDWKGNEVARVYTDEFGGYNALLPSTFTVNVASPSGVSPNMLTLTLNDPVLPDGSPDPNYDPDYSVTSWTLHYEAGRTSYLDTPLVPVAAFVNFPFAKLDAEPRDQTPVLAQVAGEETAFGPLVCLNNNPATVGITLTSAGPTTVPNPDYSIDGAEPVTIVRDYGFGADEGQVLLDTDPTDSTTPPVDITTLGGAIVTWADDTITITLDTTNPDVANIVNLTSGVLTVMRADNGRVSETGIALTVIADCASTDPGSTVHVVAAQGIYPDRPIQAAIDAAAPGDYVLVPAGVYLENVIMDKPVRLLGAGGANTVIVATPNPSDRLSDWHTAVQTKLGTPGTDPFVANEAPGIMVLGAAGGDFTIGTPALIDGFAISGAIAGGGLAVHTDVHDLVISNNRIINNQGQFAGGIAIGTPDTGTPANIQNLVIRGNLIAKNGGIQGGGGLGIYSGADNYLVENNIIIGNFSRFNGGGINHVGLSDGGTISHNKILFNEIFYGMLLAGVGDGGGINVAGEVIGGDGAGNVRIDGNLIQGNLTGSGKGGGINTYAFDSGGDFYSLEITNNIIVNNVAGFKAGGIYLHDAIDPVILNNTIANNDASATAALAFAAGTSVSTPQPAGLVASAFSWDNTEYSNPWLENNIIWHNRSFTSDGSYNNGAGGLVFNGYWDLAVINTTNPTDQLFPAFSILTSLAGPNGEDYNTGDNYTDDPALVHPAINALYSAAVSDEGGNSISVRFTPLSEGLSDYHLTGCSWAVDRGNDTGMGGTDIDGDARPDGVTYDIGADEYLASQSEYTRLTLLSPNGGELVPLGSSYTIAWGAPADLSADHFVLSYSLDNGATWLVIDANVPAGQFCYPWTLSAEAMTNGSVLVKVEAFADAAGNNSLGSDTSDAVFTLDAQALIAPNGGEVLLYDAAAPTTYQVRWQNPYPVDPSDVVELSYRLASTDTWTPITDCDPIAGDATSCAWTIPAVTEPVYTAQLQLVIKTSLDVERLTDVSDNPFTIRPAPPIPPVVPPVDPPLPPTGGVVTPPTTGAGIVFQCPDSTGQLAAFSDDNLDGILRADEGEIIDPLYPNQVCMHLAAGDGFTKMADGMDLYMFGFGNVTGVPDDMVMDMWDMGGGMLAANFPAPLIRVKEGDKVYLTLSNVGMMMRPDLFDPHTVHWHGFPNASAIFDGVPDASISINMGSSLTYFYNVAEPGTFMYHCHVEATEHMQMGMLGNLYVTPAQDGTLINGFDKFAYNDGDGSTGYGVEAHVQLSAFDPDFHEASLNIQALPFALMDDKYPMFNGRGYPETVNTTPGAILNREGYEAQRSSSLITASKLLDRRILLRLSSLSTTSFHTVTVLGIPMQVVGFGSRQLPPERYRMTNSVTIGGGQATDIILDLTDIDPGTYFMYVNNLDHLANDGEDFGGMMTEIVVNP